MIETGRLKEMIHIGLRGMTSNPTIFDKAISNSNSYDEKIAELADLGKSVFEIYDDLTVRDIQDAADIFRPVYDETNRLDGYVSLEINPELADDAEETIREGRRLFKKVNRPNVMLKVPSTEAGFKAVEELLALGINVNTTLIFSLEQYIRTAEAFLRGVMRLSRKQSDLGHIASVASVFVSRIDTVVDKMLDEKIGKESDAATKEKLSLLKGKAAVANSRIIYNKYVDIFSKEDFKDLADRGARVQRVLWGSTSTKNPNYSDIKYVEELIAKDSVNTIPDNTFTAFLDHGEVKEAITADVSESKMIVDNLMEFNIDINTICKKLLDDGVAAFKKSFTSLLDSIEAKAKAVCKR
jgi:transaldolase